MTSYTGDSKLSQPVLVVLCWRNIIKRELFNFYLQNFYSQTTHLLSMNGTTSNDVIFQNGGLDRNSGSITVMSRNKQYDENDVGR